MSENDSTAATTTGHRDRSGRLVFGGVLLCLVGAGAILLGLATLASMLYLRQLAEIPQASKLGVGQAVSGCLTYLGIGAVLVALGVGSFLRRRWSRPLVLVVAWGWLVVGIFTGVMVTAVMPVALRDMPAGPGAMVGIYGCLGAVFGLFGVLVPATLIGLYRGDDVRATLAARDPREHWTERIPLPLLWISVWMGFGAVSSLLTIFHPILAIGSEIVTGPVAVLVYLLNAGIMAWVAVGLARRSRIAWWVGLLTFVGWGVWSIVTLPRIDVDALMAQVDRMQPQPSFDMAAVFQDPRFYGSMVLIWLGTIGYFIYVRRYLDR